ncbi:rod shape-determining protein MreC [Alicyclobacillus cycloheptanicus]|nr:rod shape-determining protein MreC [Alicyclobacillus cycloheptanicus]
MSRLVTSRRLFILLASVIVLIVIAGLTLRAGGGTAVWPESVVMDVENTVGGWIYRPVSKLTGFLAGLHDLHQMYVENAELKSELQNYAQLQIELKDAQAEDARLGQMLGFKQGAGKAFTTVPAAVVGRDPSAWNSEITINVGTADGVQSGMAVVSTDGSLVGRVSVAAQFSSKVLLITDTQVGDSVSARVQVPGANQPFGIVSGSSQVPGDLEMNFLSPLLQVKPGDTVVTSGLSTSMFPGGLRIGTVVRLQQGVQGLTQSAVVKPAADLAYLQNVFVVKGKAVQGGETP